MNGWTAYYNSTPLTAVQIQPKCIVSPRNVCSKRPLPIARSEPSLKIPLVITCNLCGFPLVDIIMIINVFLPACIGTPFESFCLDGCVGGVDCRKYSRVIFDIRFQYCKIKYV